jgi:predicted transcriptional regulator
MSIKPKYAEKIFSGEKTVEFRRKVWNKWGIRKIILYASSPVSKVVGEVQIYYPMAGTKPKPTDLASLWWNNCDYGGIAFDEFRDYFKGCSRGYGLNIKSAEKYRKARPLTDYGITRPPQNFMYLKEQK